MGRTGRVLLAVSVISCGVEEPAVPVDLPADVASEPAGCHPVAVGADGECCEPGHVHHADHGCVPVGPPECAGALLDPAEPCVPRWCWEWRTSTAEPCEPDESGCRPLGFGPFVGSRTESLAGGFTADDFLIPAVVVGLIRRQGSRRPPQGHARTSSRNTRRNKKYRTVLKNGGAIRAATRPRWRGRERADGRRGLAGAEFEERVVGHDVGAAPKQSLDPGGDPANEVSDLLRRRRRLRLERNPERGRESTEDAVRSQDVQMLCEAWGYAGRPS